MADHILFVNQLRKVINNVYHGKIIYLTISGSDLYGFRSHDSDVDFRGCFQIKTNNLLGIYTPKETIEYETYKTDATISQLVKEPHSTIENEAVLHELKKEIGLMLKGNCNIYEHIFAEPIETSMEHMELKDLTEQLWNTTGLYNSYRGMAHQNYTKFILGGKHSAKKYLYVLRALLAGTYAIKERRIEPNLEKLNEFFDEPIITELIDLKRRGLEKDPVKHMDKYDQCCDKFFKEIDLAFVQNKEIELPDEKIADTWLKEQRLEYLD